MEPSFQLVNFFLLCEDCLVKFKKLDRVIFYDSIEFKKHMTGEVKNIYDSLLSGVNIVDECEYLENAYKLYNDN